MNFIFGVALLAILVPFNTFVLKILPKLSPQLSQVVLYSMTFGNMVIAVVWALGLKSEITNVRPFLTGIGLAVLLNTGYKISYVILKLNK